jgi:DNA-binding beta-propeller fold protein YncE
MNTIRQSAAFGSWLLSVMAAAIWMPVPASSQTPDPPQTILPGPRADGSVLLPNQWTIRPAGRQIELSDFPAAIAVHPAGIYAAILHAGYGKHAVVVVDIPAGRVVQEFPLNEGFYGLEFSSDGSTLFCSGASDEVIHQLEFHNGRLTLGQTIRLRPAKERGIPAGLAVSRDGRRLYAANVWRHVVTAVNLAGLPQVVDIPLTSTNSNLATNLVATPADFDLAAAAKRAAALDDPTMDTDPFPYACRLDEKRHRLYVSLWAQACVAVIDLRSNQVVARWPAGPHPNEMLLSHSGRLLYVANANHNSVSVFATGTGRILETLSVALYPAAPPGSTPNSLALSPDEKILYVANADNNNIAVFDVARPGKSRAMGFIPVGWYPTSVRLTPDGKRLLVANGKGLTAKANPMGEYIGGLFRGSLGIIELPRGAQLRQQLAAYTAQAYRCCPLKPDASPAAQRPTDNPVPGAPGSPSPIKYCLYVIKENRTYDQMLGDMPEGNGNPRLCLFPERITPNHHRLAREFVLLDNFYVDSEVSADGHEWTMGAYATDFVEKSWPLSYGHNKGHSKYPYPSEGNFRIATPAGGYLWDRARAAGVSYRSYGEFVSNGKTLEDPARSRVAALQGHIDEWYQGWDLDYPDAKRVDRFIAELRRFETEGDMPRLQVLRLPNDHTSGTTAGKPTPTAMVAENDAALGRLVEAVSRSKFWPQTAIFVVEDDAQNGSDHVDAHRTIAYAISPYSQRGRVDSTMYSTSSMLRTIELILGLDPMSQFDAAATPMYRSFQAAPDLRPYQALPANVDVNERNLKTAWGSKLSEKMDFTKEDACDDLLLNEVIWRSVRGPDSSMPAPIRAAFVFPHPSDRDED